MTWRDQAICYGHEKAFTGDGTTDQVEQAKTLCTQCPVLLDCARYAMEIRPDIGVWAGVEVLDVHQRAARSRAFKRISRILSAAGEPVPEGRFQRPIEHGTARGYKTHLRRGLDPCHDCREAADRNRNALRHRRTGRVHGIAS